MDFELSDDEAALADAIRSLCAGRFPLERLRATEGPGGHLDTEAWGELADAGVFSLQVGEAAGGVGLGMAAAAVVFEELGRALVPGPILSSHLAAAIIDGAADGKTVVGAVRRPVASGTEAFVPTLVGHLSSLGVLVVVADDGLTAVDPTEIDAVALGRSLDPLTPMWRVDRLPEGRPIGGAEEARNWRRDSVGPRGCPPRGSGRRDHGPGGRLRQAAGAVREADRVLPGGEAHVRRHAGGVRDGTIGSARRRRDDRPARRGRSRAGGGRRGTSGRGGGDQEREDFHPGPRGDGLHMGGRRPTST